MIPSPVDNPRNDYRGTDPYLLLGVARDAEAGEIKAAFLRLAKQHHPDVAAAGDNRFGAIKAAYELLSDPERRRRYDLTGDTADPTNMEAEIRTRLVEVFQVVMSRLIQAGKEPCFADFMAEVRQALATAITNHQQKADNGRRAIAALRTMDGRFSDTGSSEPPFLELLRRAEIARFEAAIRSIDDEVAVLVAATQFVRTTRYRFDPEPTLIELPSGVFQIRFR